MLARAVRVASIRGIEVRLDPSLVLLALALAWLLWSRFATVFGSLTGAGMAAAGSLLFFASILAHELAHAFEAQHRSIEVKAITLLLFGGVTEMHTESQRPRDEFVIAAVGPYVSLVCAALFHLAGVLAGRLLEPATAAPVAELAALLAYLNLLLAVFNLVPGAPLDGGRVLRAGLWWLTKDRRRAVRGAARAGQAFGLVVVAFGVAELAAGLEVAAIGGLWWLLIGAFLFNAARTELRRADTHAVMDGRTTADALGGLPQVVAADQPVASVNLAADGPDHLLVRDRGETAGILGWVPANLLAGLDPTDRSVCTAGYLAEAIDDLDTVGLDTPLAEVVRGFVAGSRRLRVVDDGATVAVLTERRTAEVLRDLGRNGRTARTRTRDRDGTDVAPAGRS
jgi:Zn-dependent protease